MERTIEIIALILIGIVVLLATYFLLSKGKSINITKGEELNRACLELMKNGCDESSVLIDSKTFEEVCKDNGLTLEECKKYCGCSK